MALSNITVNNVSIVGVDASPISGSRNLIESGGVLSFVESLYTGRESLISGKECYENQGTVFFSDSNIYSYKINSCEPGELVQVYSYIGDTAIEFMYVISFWNEYPVTSPVGEKCIEAIKADSYTCNQLYLYNAYAPLGTKYVLYCSYNANGMGIPTGKGSIAIIEEEVDILKLNFLIEKRNNDIIKCLNINISLEDLPHSSNGTDIEKGFSYIDSNENIKIKTH